MYDAETKYKCRVGDTRQIIHGVPKKTTGTPLLAMLPQKTFVPWTLSDRHIYAN